MSVIFPVALFALPPLFDLVRILTRNPEWARAAFWSALIGVVAVAVAAVPELTNWLAAGRHTATRSSAIPPLTLHVAALAPLTLGVFERWHLAGLTRAAATAAMPSITRLEMWPMALAMAGAAAWLVGAWMADELDGRVGYQPTVLPSRA